MDAMAVNILSRVATQKEDVMKVSAMLFISIFGVLGSVARASDILSCQAADSLSSRSLRVFSSASASGYDFELYLSHKLAHEPPGPYATGEVTRHGMTFENSDINIVHLFGEYAYMDRRDGTDLRFPDSGCTIAGDSSAATVSLKDLPTNKMSSNDTVTCSHENLFRTIYVTVQPTTHDGIFRAIITEKDKFTYSIPGEPLPIIAEYDKVFHNQHIDLYTSNDSQFSLLLGDGSQPHLRARAGYLDMDVSCSQD